MWCCSKDSRRGRKVATLSVLVAATVAAALATGCTAARTGSAASTELITAETLAWERQLAELVNRHRTERGLGRLRYDHALGAIARDHSLAMAEGDAAFAHDGLELRTARAWANRGSVFYLGENLAIVRPANDRALAMALARWLRSDTHRTVLEGCFGSTGVGIALTPDRTLYITQLFARDEGSRRVCRR
jgi:uncharacterized protein YkwD